MLVSALLLAVLFYLILTAPLVQASTTSFNLTNSKPIINQTPKFATYIFETQAKIAKQKAEKRRLEALEAKRKARLAYLATIKPKPVYTPQNGSYSANLYEYRSCTWWVKNNRPSIPNGWGNASNWLYSARNAGYSTGATPRAGAIGTRLGGNHVVYVISVSGDQVTVGDGNYDYSGSYRVKTVHYSEYYYIYF